MIDLREVTVSLGGTPVLDGVSTSVDEGTFVGLVGPNGAGKTTLLRTINGYLSPDGGHVRIGGDPVGTLPTREVARRVATVPQGTSLGFDFDVRSVVEMGRHARRSRLGGDDDREQVRAALERAEVAALADRPVSAISGGERQRVLIARALAQDAPVLLLDEPTASLDIHHQVRTLALARDLAREGRTVLAAIHDLDLAARYCDELRLLAGARLRASGPPREVLTEPHLRAAFDTTPVVGRDPATGAVSVTAL
ncbi:MAG: ABC transporter ATP-binding protein, partial [Halobacteriales archaeon]